MLHFQAYGEIIFSIMKIEFIDQLIEHEPVLTIDLESAPDVIGLALKAILAVSNPKEEGNNPFFRHQLSDIVQDRIFYTRNDYAKNQLRIHGKQTRVGNAYINTPAYQASKAQNITDFGRYYLHFRIEATDNMIFMGAVFNE
jgi:hypothetical protein